MEETVGRVMGAAMEVAVLGAEAMAVEEKGVAALAVVGQEVVVTEAVVKEVAAMAAEGTAVEEKEAVVWAAAMMEVEALGEGMMVAEKVVALAEDLEVEVMVAMREED